MLPWGVVAPQGPRPDHDRNKLLKGGSLKPGNVIAVLVGVLVLCAACSLWFRADSVDAGITDQQVDSLGMVPSTPDSLEADTLEEAEGPPLLLDYPEEPEPAEEGTN